MVKTLTYRLLKFVLLLCLVSPLYSQTTATLDRPDNVVLLTGQTLSDWNGEDLARLRFYRYSPAGWQAIPFQIDELDGGANYFIEGNGVLDATDEIVFTAAQTGDQAPPDAWIDDVNARASARYEIECTDPLTQEKGWVYAYLSATLATDNQRFLQVDASQDSVTTDDFILVHGGSGFLEDVYLRPEAGGDGVDIQDRQKLRIQARVDIPVLGSKTITIREEMNENISFAPGVAARIRVSKKSSSYHTDAPMVRLFREMTLEIKITSSLIDDEVFDISFVTAFYPQYMEWSSGALEFSLGDMGSLKEVRITNDHSPQAQGMILSSPRFDDDLSIGSTIQTVAQPLAWPGNNWFLVAADTENPSATVQTGSVVTILSFEGEPLGSEQNLYYFDFPVNLSFNPDTGDNMSFGESGVEVKGSDISGVISFSGCSYYFADNLDTTEARQVMEGHVHPVDVAATSQILSVQYPLTLNVEPADGGDVAAVPPGETYESGTSVQLTAQPADGFAFSHWSGDLSGSDNPQAVIMDAEKFVTAHFIAQTRVVVTTQPPGLNVVVDDESFTAPAAFTWPEGSVHTLGVDSLQAETEGERNKFAGWQHGQTRIHDYTTPSADVTLTADFETQYFLATSVTPEESGRVEPASPGAWYDENAWAVYRAFPADDYVFQDWMGDNPSSNNPDSVRMDGPQNVTARFINYAPELAVGDTVIFEDDSLKISFSDLYAWASDANHPDDALTYNIAGGNVMEVTIPVEPEANYDLLIASHIPDWFGTDTLTITVTDPLGESATARWPILVLSVPDAPADFDLLEPVDGVSLSAWPDSMQFVWEESQDPDPWDLVTYTFYLDTTDAFDSSQLLKAEGLETHRLTLRWPAEMNHSAYFWKVDATDQTGFVAHSSVFSLYAASGVETDGGHVPDDFVLEQNYPNPFNSSTLIRFGVPQEMRVNLTVFNNLGQPIRQLLDQTMPAGYHTVRWEGLDDRQRDVSSGVYFFVLETRDQRQVRKTLLIR